MHPIALKPQGDGVYCYHFDATGNTVALTDQNQSIASTYAYQPYGEMNQGQTQTITQPFTYVGQYGVMAEPYGYYYMRARYYDSGSGRFVSEDPLVFGGGVAAASGALAEALGATACETEVGAIVGVPTVLVGTASLVNGTTAMMVCLMNESPSIPSAAIHAMIALTATGDTNRAAMAYFVTGVVMLSNYVGSWVNIIPSKLEMISSGVDFGCIQSGSVSRNTSGGANK